MRGFALRDKDKMMAGHKIAIDAFGKHIHECADDDTLAGFVQMLCTLSAKTIHGMEGGEFKRDFLSAAIKDSKYIPPQRVQ